MEQSIVFEWEGFPNSDFCWWAHSAKIDLNAWLKKNSDRVRITARLQSGSGTQGAILTIFYVEN